MTEPARVVTSLLCPFCNGELDEELYNDVYGCDTGCQYVRVEIECPHCHRINWDSGSFGEILDEEDRQEYREQFHTEFQEAMLKIAKERGAA